MRLGSSGVCQQLVSAPDHHDEAVRYVETAGRRLLSLILGKPEIMAGGTAVYLHDLQPSGKVLAAPEGGNRPLGGSKPHQVGTASSCRWKIIWSMLVGDMLASKARLLAEEESTGSPLVLHNEERRSWRHLWKAPAEGLSVPVCSMELPLARQGGWAGPRIRMTLPSFSGATAECPDLLHYACQLRTNVRAVQPARVQVLLRFPPCQCDAMRSIPFVREGASCWRGGGG